MSSPKPHEHGTIKSYVVGFILSIIFTLIPYYLVVNKNFAGTALDLVILSFAVTQMIIQVTFFLHLGRGPKPNWNFFFFISTVGIILVVVGGSIVIISNLHYNMQPSDQVKKIINDENIYQVGGKKTGSCEGQYSNHKVYIKDGLVNPIQTNARQCDTLTFVNQDDTTINLTFGDPPNNEAYAGLSKLNVQKSKNETITLSDAGTFKFYDPSSAATIGSFAVSQAQ
jgi:cytochrome o ubiquinol oxidase operon protein cyoD